MRLHKLHSKPLSIQFLADSQDNSDSAYDCGSDDMGDLRNLRCGLEKNENFDHYLELLSDSDFRGRGFTITLSEDAQRGKFIEFLNIVWGEGILTGRIGSGELNRGSPYEAEDVQEDLAYSFYDSNAADVTISFKIPKVFNSFSGNGRPVCLNKLAEHLAGNEGRRLISIQELREATKHVENQDC